ncbi:hypothetical protein QN277_009219 [Acacia crassicarpa]|uniref:Uncharacterized protein n=1 Tax=Acacia crassicarpa TaxID=499986 RepID=A0AAE1JNG5_9FABA|nr:hypothetical protein QN277_009219 [Acacia crassicarpa]
MMFSGRSMGGGGGGSGSGMLRTFSRTVARVGNGVQDPYSSSSTTVASPTSNRTHRRPNSSTCLSISSPINSHSINPITDLPFHYSYPEADDWIAVEGLVDEGFNEFSGSYVSGNVPSPGSGCCVSGNVSPPDFNDFSVSYLSGKVPSDQEVDTIVTSLRDVFGSNSHHQPNYDSSGSDMDWREPSMYPYDTRMQQYGRYAAVYHAFNLLENDQSVQKMVKSFSCDKSIWDAVLENEVLRELKEQSLTSDNDKVSKSPDDDKALKDSDSDGIPSGRGSRATTNVVIWMFNSSKVKFMELVEKITKIMTALFRAKFHNKGEKAEFSDAFAEKVRTSFMLTIIVFLVVVVSRARKV